MDDDDDDDSGMGQSISTAGNNTSFCGKLLVFLNCGLCSCLHLDLNPVYTLGSSGQGVRGTRL